MTAMCIKVASGSEQQPYNSNIYIYNSVVDWFVFLFMAYQPFMGFELEIINSNK